jgi:hypothetical protein
MVDSATARTECARPRAQHAPTGLTRPSFPGLISAFTLLRPGTGALRQGLSRRLGSNEECRGSRRILSFVIFATILLSLNCWSGDSPSPAGGTNSAGASPPPAVSAANEPKDYLLPDLGTLRLDVPKGWNDSYNSTTMLDTSVDTVQFVPRDHSDYVVLIQAIHMKPGAADNFDVKTNLTTVAQHELGNSVELLPDIHDLKSPRMEGAWIRLTDQHVSATNPKPGEYKYLTQGYAKVNGLVLSFRVVSNRADGNEQSLALDMIRSARLSPIN